MIPPKPKNINKFCTHCGAKLVHKGKIWVMSHDEDTGEPDSFRARICCPKTGFFSNGNHTDCNVYYKPGDKGWWRDTSGKPIVVPIDKLEQFVEEGKKNGG